MGKHIVYHTHSYRTVSLGHTYIKPKETGKLREQQTDKTRVGLCVTPAGQEHPL